MSAEVEVPELPVDSYREAAAFLRRPFTPEAVKFKVQSTWSGGALVVAYIDARLVVERLNLVCPHLWSDGDSYKPMGARHMVCRLTVDGLCREDVGQGEGKGLYSDALKRAAVKFGVGVSLYAIPKMILNVSSGDLKEKKDGGKTVVTLTDKGEATCRGMYRAWLEAEGAQSFGAPLNHGDAEGAVGDVEVPAPDSGPGTSDVPAEPINLDRATIIGGRALDAKVPWDKLRLAVSHLLGADCGPIESEVDAVAAVGKLDAAQAEGLEAWIERKAGE